MAALESVSKTPTPPQPVTPTSCRRAAAVYLLETDRVDVVRWITSGKADDIIDYGGERDDLVELADLLFATAQRACRDGVVSP